MGKNKSDPRQGERKRGEAGWKLLRLTHNLRKVHLEGLGVLKPKSAIRGVPYLPGWACVSLACWPPDRLESRILMTAAAS